MSCPRLFTFVSILAFALFVPVILLAQTPAPVSTGSTLVAWLVWFWHTPFVLGGVASLLPVLAVDFQAFKAFQSIKDLSTYDWGTAAFRAAQAFIVGGLAGSVFKTVITG